MSGIGGKGEMEDIWQEANFNPIRCEETATIVEEVQSTGAVRSLPVSSQHFLISLHASLTSKFGIILSQHLQHFA